MNSIFQKHKYILLNIYTHTHTHTHTQEKARREYTKIITAVVSKYGGIGDYFILHIFHLLQVFYDFVAF